MAKDLLLKTRLSPGVGGHSQESLLSLLMLPDAEGSICILDGFCPPGEKQLPQEAVVGVRRED